MLKIPSSFIQDLIYQLRIVRGVPFSTFPFLAFGVNLGESRILVISCASVVLHTRIQGPFRPLHFL